jgi:D-3-phosphoglycerate dehydrogenase
MNRFVVIVTDHIFPSLDVERAILQPLGAELVVIKDGPEDELKGSISQADALLVCYAQIRKELIKRARRCRIIARYGIGVDNIDVQAATDMGIVVTNVPDYCVEEVSDHALALLLACARKIRLLDQRVRARRWELEDAVPVHRLSGQVLGLIGFGKIPRALVPKASSLGLTIVASDPFLDEDAMGEYGVKKVDLSTLLRQSDFVSIHAPLTPETEGIIGEAELRTMKPSAYLINTARGPLLRQPALLRALRERWIAGAALDVLPTEPPSWDDSLISFDNVILTPHISFYSEESLLELQRKAAEEVARVMTGRPPKYGVNRVRVRSSLGRRQNESPET